MLDAFFLNIFTVKLEKTMAFRFYFISHFILF
jgi:hypothetical protein